jgi:Ca-activated chloride channel family protein
MNRPVITLTKKDFTVYERNEPQEIKYFGVEEAPISVAILFDVSKSMIDKIESERQAIVEFFNNANPNDEYFAITFSDRPRLIEGPTSSIDDLQRRLTAVEPSGPTAMLDAVYLAESTLRSARYKRKAIVIFSDGGDNVSRYTLAEIKSLAQESDAQIYAVGLFETFFSTIEEKLGKMWLSGITDRTGGRTFTVDDRTKVSAAAATISRELRNQYVIGYRPKASSDGKWHKIRVRVNQSTLNQPFQTSYRQGYIADDHCVGSTCR